jgi:hypothetical protein
VRVDEKEDRGDIVGIENETVGDSELRGSDAVVDARRITGLEGMILTDLTELIVLAISEMQKATNELEKHTYNSQIFGERNNTFFALFLALFQREQWATGSGIFRHRRIDRERFR